MFEQVSSRVADLAEQYEVPEKLNRAYEKVSAAGESARQGAITAYRAALDHPKTSIGGLVLAAALVGGLLWYMFGDSRRPLQRRRHSARMRAGSERRRKHRTARAAAA